MEKKQFSTDLLNNEIAAGEGFFMYYDPTKKHFVSFEGDQTDAPNDWILLPYREKLLPSYAKLVDQFLDANGYDLPTGNVRRAEYLRKKGFGYEFQEYEMTRLEEAAKEWCKGHGIPV